MKVKYIGEGSASFYIFGVSYQFATNEEKSFDSDVMDELMIELNKFPRGHFEVFNCEETSPHSHSNLIVLNATQESFTTTLKNKYDIATSGVLGTTIYVDGHRTDIYTENGSIAYPFKTIQAAINSVTDASDNKRYLVSIIGGMTYLEQLILKAFVYLRSDKIAIVKNTGGSTIIAGGTGSKSYRIENIFAICESDNENHAALEVSGNGNISIYGSLLHGVSVDPDSLSGAEGIKITSGFVLTDKCSIEGWNWALNISGGIAYCSDSSFTGYENDVQRTGGTLKLLSPTFSSGGVVGTHTLETLASHIGNNSLVPGFSVKDALETLLTGVPGASRVTDKYHVDGLRGIDVGANGDIDRPFKTIQACLNFIGQPINHIDAMRSIHIYISGNRSAIAGYSPQTFNGCYKEDLTVPSRRITMLGYGVKIGDNGDGSGGGNILKEYASSRRFGATSSELRPCLTMVGLCNTRDSHQRLRNGIHVAGTCRTTILKRNLSSIYGNGTNKITVEVAAGQFNYPITVSNYPTEPYIRILVTGTTNYNYTYDITSKIDDTHFEATRVTGTNVNVGVETVGIFTECDSAGSPALSHDSAFVNCYMQGQYTCDDGIVNSAAATAGTEVLFAVGSRFYTGIEGRTILLQRWDSNTLAGINIVNSIAGMLNCSISGTLQTGTFTYSTDDMGWVGCRFNSATSITVTSAAQTIRMDAVTLNSFIATGCTWLTNTPTIDYLDQDRAIKNTSGVTGATVKDALNTLVLGGATGSRPSTKYLYELYFDSTLNKPIWWNGTNWVDSTGTTV